MTKGPIDSCQCYEMWRVSFAYTGDRINRAKDLFLVSSAVSSKRIVKERSL
jgi:hypothetical protein